MSCHARQPRQARPPARRDRAARAAARPSAALGHRAQTREDSRGRAHAGRARSCARCARACRHGAPERGASTASRAGPAAHLPPGPPPPSPRRRAQGPAPAARCTGGANASRTCATPPKCSTSRTHPAPAAGAGGRRAGQAHRQARAAAPTSWANCSARSTTWRCSPSAGRPHRPVKRHQRARKQLLRAISRRRARLRERALRKGEGLYERRPRRFGAACARRRARRRDARDATRSRPGRHPSSTAAPVRSC